MAEKRGGASEGSRHTQQPGVTSGDLGGEIDHVSPEEITLTSFEDVAAPATAPDDSTPTVNADLVDDPEELARAIEEASGASVEIVSESEQDPEA
jgi:hypothetical protein